MDGDDVTNSLIFGLIVVNRYVDDPNTALNGVSGVGVVDVGVWVKVVVVSIGKLVSNCMQQATKKIQVEINFIFKF